MRTSTSNVWVNRSTRRQKRVPALVIKFSRADFRQFEAIPDGFLLLKDFLSVAETELDPSLLTRARSELVHERGVKGIAALRLQKGLSQQELAAKLGTSQPRLSTWEKGSERPGVDNLQKLKAALGVSWDELMGCFDVAV